VKVLIFGGSGAVGSLLVNGATARGHPVTAFVRDPAKQRSGRPVTVVQGDVADPDAVSQAVSGQDAVLCALGAATPLRRDPTLVAGMRHIIEVMTESGVRRLVYLSFLGVPAGRHQLSPLGCYVMAPVVLRNVAADHAEKERIVQASTLDWTIVRPPRLTGRPRTGAYRCGDDISARQIVPRISRAELADFMLDQLDDRRFLHRTPAVMP
jgi:putative NADH-flavin reductase